MTDRERTTETRLPATPSGEAEVGQLIAAAGPRPAMPAERMDRLRGAAREAWRESLERRPRRSRRAATPLALAATLAVALLGAWWWLWAPGPSAVAATVERAVGAVTAEAGDAPGSTLAPGDEVSTGESAAVALRMASGSSVRLDAATRVRLSGGERLELLNGAVYVDSGRRPGSAAVEIVTPLATVREIGTQFEVRLPDGARGGLRVRVREGTVEVGPGAGTTARVGGEPLRAVAGEELLVDASGAVDRRSLPAFGEPWEWAEAAAPRLDIEGATLAAYLDWVARETGRPVRFADPALAARTHEIVLHGSLGDLGPEASLDALLPGSGLEHRVAPDGAIVVTAPDSDSRGSVSGSG